MTEERSQELGIPRRKFLKVGAGAAFAAPVIASFGLDGVAESAGRGPVPCQYNANQSASRGMHVIQEHLMPAVTIVLQYRWIGTVQADAARRLTDELLTAALEIANHNFGLACRTLSDLTNDVQSFVDRGQIPAYLAPQLTSRIAAAQADLGCACG